MTVSGSEKKFKKILVHICCAPDATYGVKAIGEYSGNVIGLFYNPGIWPEAEYVRRLEETRKLSATYGFDLMEGPYEEEKWLEAVKGLEGEPERGKRCEICIEMRLARCSDLAKKLGCEAFTTVLTVSPKKDARMVNCIGKTIGDTEEPVFLELDLKKKDGFKKSVELTKALGIYRQNYCGCRYSLR